jgi:hypothetical protein
VPDVKRSPMPPRRKRMRPVSEKRLNERPERDALRHAVVVAADYRCVAELLVPEVRCWSPERDGLGRWWLDVDEVVGRGVKPGGHLDPSNVQALCRAHHDWKTTHPTLARERGLRRRSTDR